MCASIDNHIWYCPTDKGCYKNLFFSLKGCDFKGRHVGPCLWINNSKSRIVLVVVYVHDCCVVGGKKGLMI
jgi:hypothetical protein